MAAADWFAEAVPQAAPAPRRRQPRAVPRERVRPSARLRVRGHLAWMVAFAVLLVGVVAVNVAVLRANVSVHDLDAQRAQLQAENQALASQLSAAASAPRIEAAAHRLGLVQAPSQDTSYLDLARP